MSAPMETPVLEVRGLVKRYGGILATDHVSFSVRAGELLALIGPNGAGKSTLIGQIAGEIVPDEGEVLLDGRPVGHLPVVQRARRGLGRTFQISQVLPEFSALENVVLAMQCRRDAAFFSLRGMLRQRGVEAQAHHLLELAGLAAQAGRSVGLLSHGARKQLELAMAMALEPRVLLLDEPLAGMSPGESEQMAALLGSLRQGYPMILIEHDMDIVFALADRVGVLASGALIATGSPAEIRANPVVRASYLGEEEAA